MRQAGQFTPAVPLIDTGDSIDAHDQAQARFPNATWKLGSAAQTGLPDESQAGILATLTLHHWPDLEAGFVEVARILKPTGSMVIFTSTSEQMLGYWLNYYFPEMLADSISQMPSLQA